MFQTKSPYVLLVAGSGHAGIEAAIANLLEPGETIVVGNKGIWGQRVNDLSERYRGQSELVWTCALGVVGTDVLLAYRVWQNRVSRLRSRLRQKLDAVMMKI